MSDPLADFVLARIADDEVDSSGVHELDCDLVTNGLSDPTFGWTCSCGRPARVLAECKVKRLLIEAVVDEDPFDALGAESAYEFLILSHLALPYADHADYREEWQP